MYPRDHPPTVLLLGASVSQLAAISTAHRAGIRVLAVDGDPEAVGLPLADIAEVIDFREVDAVTEAARRHGIDGVVAISSDRAVPIAAEIARRLGLPGVDPAVALVMTDKAAMRGRLEQAGLPQPRFRAVRDIDAAAEALAAIGAPAVLKPSDSGGQRGVFKVGSERDLREALPETLRFSRSRVAILEQFVEGDELNAIAVARGGEVRLLTLSDRLRPPGRGFGVGWCHVFPSTLPGGVLERAAEVAVETVRVLGLQDGIAFPQLLARASGEIVVVEVAARIPAGQMADLVRYGIGVDLIEIALRQALGLRVADDAVEPRFMQPLAIRFLTAVPGTLPLGRLVSVTGLDDVLASPGVIDAGLYLRPGEIIQPVQVDADRRGYVIAGGDDQPAALAAANAAIRKLQVVTEPTSLPIPQRAFSRPL
jgi:biotin carboxylase